MKVTVFRSVMPTAAELEKYGEAAHFTNPPDIAWSIRKRLNKSILPQWQNSPLNDYSLHDVSEVVAGRSARLWVHGHTHGSLNYYVGTPGARGTNVVCNPLGYARGMRGEPNSNFNPTLTIEV